MECWPKCWNLQYEILSSGVKSEHVSPAMEDRKRYKFITLRIVKDLDIQFFDTNNLNGYEKDINYACSHLCHDELFNGSDGTAYQLEVFDE